MNSKAIMVVFGILSIGMVGMSPTAFAQTSQSTMSIGTTCGISIGDAMDFGTVLVDSISGQATLELTGEGSTGSVVEVYAGDWLDTSDVNQVDGEKTAFSLINGTAHSSKTNMNDTNTAIPLGANVTNQQVVNTYWTVDLVLNNAEFEGAVTQTLTFDASCV